MIRGLPLLLALCALTALAVSASPRNRSTDPTPAPAPAGDAKDTEVTTVTPCAQKTPCAWSMTDHSRTKLLSDMLIYNSYCVCDPDTQCVMNEYDSSVSAYVYRCRKETVET